MSDTSELATEEGQRSRGTRSRRSRILTTLPSILDHAPFREHDRNAMLDDLQDHSQATPEAAPFDMSPDLVARVTGGTIRGLREGILRSWRAIPYAAPPVGDLRLRAPQPVVPWQGTRDATAFGAIAPQPVRRRASAGVDAIPVDEDCLTLNVQTPVGAGAVEAGKRIPVMVFIHGGGYSAGSSRDFSGQGESFTLTGRAVFVSFNYRLGPFGYLDFTRYSTPERPIESNLGLRDQVAALRWVHDNIEQFGGDPSNVTIFGESAGGNAVTTMLGVPSAQGLFARVIAQSAPPSAVFPARLAQEWGADFVGFLERRMQGLTSAAEKAAAEGTASGTLVPTGSEGAGSVVAAAAGDAVGEAVADVAAAVTDAAAAVGDVVAGDPSSDESTSTPHGAGEPTAAEPTSTPHTPAREPGPGVPASTTRASGVEWLLTADQADLIAASNELQRYVPDRYPGAFCLAPTVDGDFLPEHPMRAVREGRGAKVPLIIGTNAREGAVFRGPLDILPTTAPRIGAMFGRAPSLSKRPMHDAYPGLPKRHDGLDFGGDYGFWYPSTVLADWHSRHAPTWSYRFDYAPRLLKLTGIDATHGVELFTLFNAFDLPLVKAMVALGGRDEYAAAGARMRKAWLRFATDGTVASRWPAYTEEKRATRIIDVADSVEYDPRSERRKAWKAFLPVFERLW